MTPRVVAAPVAPWTPASLSTGVLWYRADLGVSIDGVSGKVVGWADQIGTYDLVQTTEAQQPTLAASDVNFNGQSSIQFDGNDWLDAAADLGLAQPCWWAWVARVANGADYQTIGDAKSGTRQIERVNAGEQTSCFAGLANVESAVSITTTTVLFIVQFNGASTTHRISSSSVAVTGNAGANAMGTLRVGAAPAGVYPLLSGSAIAEGIAGTGVLGGGDVDELALLIAYVNDRYGLAIA